MLIVKNLTKKYGDIVAVDNLSFEVKKGEIFGLLGVNGAGKTTTFRNIVGLLSPDKGIITLDGHKIDYDITNNIGFLTEERSLFTKMTVEEQIMYFGILKGMNKKSIQRELDYWLDKLNIKEYKKKTIKELSKGNQQKVQFITSIIHNPKLLILDEPFTGLDPFNVTIIMSLLKELAQKGSIIIFSSHRMEQVEVFCDSILILVNGKTVLKGSLKEIKQKYQKKKIHIVGTIDESEIKSIPGVERIKENHGEYVIDVTSKDIVKKIFACLKKSDDITKFSVEDSSLNEIFVNCVGEMLHE